MAVVTWAVTWAVVIWEEDSRIEVAERMFMKA